MLTPCEFECRAGRSTMRNWKTLICVGEKPISYFLEIFTGHNRKKQCHFIHLFLSSAEMLTSADGAIQNAVSDTHPLDNK